MGHDAEIRRLREERDAARRLLDLAGTVILSVGVDGRIATVNRAAAGMLGYAQADLIGQNFFDVLVPASEREERRAAFAQMLAGDAEQAESESEIITRN